MKTKIILSSVCILMLLHPISLHAQEIQWQNTIGGTAEDYLVSAEQTSDGGYILGGYSMSGISGDKTENSLGPPGTFSDYWIIKTDSLGTIQWQNTIGGTFQDYLSSVQQTADGGFIIGGYSRSNISGDKTEGSMGNYDYWIVKTDPLGNIQWQNTIGGNYDDLLTSVQQTVDGGYIVGGYSQSGISGDKSENAMGYSDYWIVKTDASGNVQWDNTIGGSNEDKLFSVMQTIDGGYMLGGYSGSNISGDKTENNIGGVDYWIVKTDSLGNIVWQNTIGGSSSDLLTSMKQTYDRGYILGGYSNSFISGDKTENSFGDEDYWIVKTDSSGNIQWENTIGGIGLDQLYSIEQTSDNGYILGGWSTSNISGKKTENCLGSYDYWILKTDSLGNIEWQNTIGGDGTDQLYSMRSTNDGGFILGGMGWSHISGDKTENIIGFEDYWLVKITCNYNSITGKVYADLNSNNVQDGGDISINHQMVVEQNTGRFAFSNSNGRYSVGVLDTGYFIVYANPMNYYSSVPQNQNAMFTALHQTDSLNDFAFQPAIAVNDLCATITPLGPFRAGFNASYLLSYNNSGTTAINNCSIIFFMDNDVSYISSNSIPFSVTADSVIWSIGTLTPFQSGSILVTVQVNASAPIGTLINSGVRIEPVVGDVNPACNISYWEVYTTGSFDPNDILVSHDSLFTWQFPNPPYTDYIIRFQNTGNDTAFNIKVLNPIDTNFLALSTLEFVASSHPVNLTWITWERNMEFKFDNILLPDSNINEPLSHGYVRYRIKPKSTLVIGDSISNNAYIYFDYNAPVATNTAITKVLLTTGLIPGPSANENEIAIFPNPVKDKLNIIVASSKLSTQMIIYNTYSRKVLEVKINPSGTAQKITLDISNLATGVYTVDVQTGGKMKFIKQ